MALNNQQWLICHKTQPMKLKPYDCVQIICIGLLDIDLSLDKINYLKAYNYYYQIGILETIEMYAKNLKK